MRAVFIMIKCEMGQAYRVAREMADGIPELSEMHSISSQYDLLGKFYLEADRDIGLFVVETIQTVPGVKDTYTLQTQGWTICCWTGRAGFNPFHPFAKPPAIPQRVSRVCAFVPGWQQDR